MRMVLFTAALLVGVGPSFADETVIHRDGPGPAPVVRDRSVTVEKGGSDCASKSVHKEDGAGDSKTVTKTNCD